MLKGKVDPGRVGVLGICASGGYASFAVQADSRVKALATVSAACVGRITRNGDLHKENNKEVPEAISRALQVAGQWRNSTAGKEGESGETPRMFDAKQLPDNADSFFKDAAAYYGSERGCHPRSDQRVPLPSYDLMDNYGSFNFQHLISPRPLSMVAGADTQTLHYSEAAVAAARDPKKLFVVQGKNHFDLYDNLSVSGPKLVEFFGKYL